MKTISLWQPWASLIACGAKRIETRSWPARYTGLIAIHAAKKWDTDLRCIALSDPFLPHLERAGFDCNKRDFGMPFGCVVATAYLESSHQVIRREGGYALLSNHSKVTGSELAFGDYADSRWAWVLCEIKALRTPVPWKGRQQWFDVPDKVITNAL